MTPCVPDHPYHANNCLMVRPRIINLDLISFWISEVYGIWAKNCDYQQKEQQYGFGFSKTNVLESVKPLIEDGLFLLYFLKKENWNETVFFVCLFYSSGENSTSAHTHIYRQRVRERAYKKWKKSPLCQNILLIQKQHSLNHRRTFFFLAACYCNTFDFFSAFPIWKFEVEHNSLW